jgi:hypothetical protein
MVTRAEVKEEESYWKKFEKERKIPKSKRNCNVATRTLVASAIRFSGMQNEGRRRVKEWSKTRRKR